MGMRNHLEVVAGASGTFRTVAAMVAAEGTTAVAAAGHRTVVVAGRRMGRAAAEVAAADVKEAEKGHSCSRIC